MALDLLQLLTSLSRLHAEHALLLRRTVERMFLLGIEIGQREPLSAEAKARYDRTQATARQVLVMRDVMEGQPQQKEVEGHIAHALSDWLEQESALKKMLENGLGEPIDDMPEKMPAEQYETLKSQIKLIAVATGRTVTDEEIEEVVQKLLFPFDRPE